MQDLARLKVRVGPGRRRPETKNSLPPHVSVPGVNLPLSRPRTFPVSCCDRREAPRPIATVDEAQCEWGYGGNYSCRCSFQSGSPLCPCSVASRRPTLLARGLWRHRGPPLGSCRVEDIAPRKPTDHLRPRRTYVVATVEMPAKRCPLMSLQEFSACRFRPNRFRGMNLQEFSVLFGLGGTFGRVVDDTTSLTGPWGGWRWLG